MDDLKKLKLSAFPKSASFMVKVKADGDVVHNINFKLERLAGKMGQGQWATETQLVKTA